MNNSDVVKHIKGESIFLDDMPVPAETLYAVIFDSPVAHGKIKSVNFDKALAQPGVVKIITAKDIPGENQIGNIIADETLLAENTVEYIGEPVAIIAADTTLNAKKARKLIEIEIEELEPITDPREAYAKGSLIQPPVVFSSGDVEKSFAECEIIVENRVDIAGQEHLYLETQGAVSIPQEDGGVKIFSSTQGPTAVQKGASRVLGISMNKVEVDVMRLGGGFGGKEDQATPWGAISALAAILTKRPVKIILDRKDDLRMTGKRHPYSADYKLGLNKDGKILAYEAVYYQNAGACADLSTAVLERTLFHASNSYFIPNLKATGISSKTNLPPNTAFRGFGGPQGMFVLEAAIHEAAEKLCIPAYEIQQKNLISEGQEFYYGQKAERAQAEKCWNEAIANYKFEEKINSVKVFNSANKMKKKGLAVMPICFGISFTSSFLNQASALVHIYNDGSIGISTAAVEMGQGVNEKMRSIAARIFSLPMANIRIETTNTTRVANTSPTAASAAADLNGNAVLIACTNLKERLIELSAKLLKTDKEKINFENSKIISGSEEINWKDLIWQAYFNRISLSAQAYYATPKVHFDRTINKGRPFAYHVYGTAIVQSTVDCLRGTYEVDSVEVIHDFGKSLHPQIDLGQAEGAIVQGIGWLTVEELVQNENGKLLSNTLSTYKIPDIYFAPKKIAVHFLDDSENPFGPFQSKAIGEPPFMYGIGAYFSLLNAMKQFNPEAEIAFNAPMTPERVLMGLHKSTKKKTIEPALD